MELKTLFRDIADSIRDLDGSSAPIMASDFPNRIRKMKFLATGSPGMTSNTTPAPFSVFGAGEFNGEVPMWCAFDGDISTAWAARSNQNWIALDCGSQTNVRGISLLPRGLNAALMSQFPKTGVISGSNDKNTWVKLAELDGSQPQPTDQTYRDVIFSTTASYRYYKLHDLVSYDSTYHYIGIAEIRFLFP